MAFALVNPVSALWQRRGLTSLLMPDGYDAFAAPQQSAQALSGYAPRVKPADVHAGQPQANHAHAGQPRERQSWQQSRAQAPQVQQQQSQTTQAQAHAQTHAGHTAAQATDQPAGQGKPAAWLPLPPHVWPAPWQTRLEQTRPGPVLWTYWNLGPDMCDPQTPGRLERRQFLQRLLQDLGHPAGTHTFWPSCLPPDPAALPAAATQQESAYVANPDVFWSGAMQLKAR